MSERSCALKSMVMAAIAIAFAAGVPLAQDTAPSEPGAPVTAASPTPGAVEGSAATGSASAPAAAAPASASSAAASQPATGDGSGAPRSPAQLFNFSQGSGPLKIKSDKMIFDQKGKSVVFNGHVHADRGDGELTSDALRVLFVNEKLHDVSEMIAEGDVRISQGARYATADHAALDQAKHIVVLTGNPVVHDGTDQIAGTRITVDLNTGQSVVEGARAVIFPRRSENADNGSAVDHVR